MREALAYPSDAEQIKHKTFRDALNDLNLKELEPDLDKSRDWREELNEDQLTRLAFVRTLIHEPSWILIDEVLDFVDARSRALITGALEKRLKGSAVIHIGRQLPNDGTFRTLSQLLTLSTPTFGIAGDPGAVTDFGVRFSAMVPVPDDDAGATIEISGKVLDKLGDNKVTVDIVAKADGAKVLTRARATVRLP